MFKPITVCGALVSLSILLGSMPAPATEEAKHSSQQDLQFVRIEQPLGHKIAVTIVGLSLMGVELWWFLGAKSKTHQPQPPDQY